MAKWFGEIGFMETIEDPDSPGVFVETITKRNYYGDIIRFNKRFDGVANQTNDDLEISNEISILADPFAVSHFYAIRYVEWLGTKFKANRVDVDYPRLNISIGGVYNGDPDE